MSLQGVVYSTSLQLHSDPPQAVDNTPADLLMPARDTD